MRRSLVLALLQIVVLHTLDGRPLRADANRVDVFRSTKNCHGDAGAAVSIGSAVDICVKETPEQICEIIKPWKKCEAAK